MTIADRDPAIPLVAPWASTGNNLGDLSPPRQRLRVDGKFFARAGRRMPLRGVTYGPFAPDPAGDPFPAPEQVRDDFRRMLDLGVNTVRAYHVPPSWLLHEAAEYGLGLLVDVPWPKHVCFLESRKFQADARGAVRAAVERGRHTDAVIAYSIANEIPPDVVRWHGALRVERFLGELRDVVKQADPDALTTYANYPPTEYLDLSFLDFVTFNVYLHDRETFRRYLLRLQHLVGDRPLVLGELGMDTRRQGEIEQAELLAGHVREAALAGLAGTFVFSWTDDWFTGGHPIEDWAFGITRRDRSPKASYHALREVYELASTASLLEATPRVSVVVCSYNGGATLEDCLKSLSHLNYPDYEVILVDDGSTDDTRHIAARYPDVQSIHQANLGLSEARNVGLRAATGAVIAYTDADCVADPDWLSLLVHQLLRSGAAAVGGPNLSPEDGPLAACVAASPGQPTHVLLSDQVAEHIPGCNMAYRREALLAVNGFDPIYRKAGDDVDLCWRLEHAGMWITFAPGAFVWHHRRQTPLAYLKQQMGYGEAEALLRFKHPEKFNGWGQSKWRGMLYGISLQGLRLGGDTIYRGTFASGMFQCVYQRGPAHWAMLPTTLEWQLAALLSAVLALGLPLAWWLTASMVGATLLVTALQGVQTRLSPGHGGLRSRCVVAVLSYLQPLARSWARHRTRLFSRRSPILSAPAGDDYAVRMRGSGSRTIEYWSERGDERTALLDQAIAYLDEHRWGKAIDSGWSDWDLAVSCYPWSSIQICTVQEEHGCGKRLIRVRYRLRPNRAIAFAAVLAAAGGLSVGVPLSVVLVGAVAFLAAALAMWWAAIHRTGHIVAALDRLARRMGLMPCTPPHSRAADAQRRDGVGISERDTQPEGSITVVVPSP